jgi:membrane protease YdiL (CAAX protease family)
MNQHRSAAVRALYIIAFGLLAFFIAAVAGGVWSVLIILNLRVSPAVPWSVLVMALLLWLIWSYLAGKGWPRSTSSARAGYLRANHRPARIYLWSFAAGFLSVIALAGLWIVLFRLIKMPPNALPDVSGYPRLTVAFMILMGSLVAPFMEEAGFRGYFQVALERQFPAVVAVTVSSIVFAVAHFNYGMLWPKLLIYFLVGVSFGAIAYLTNSTLPAILPHIAGDLLFFLFIWPHDSSRPLVAISGADTSFWLHLAQALVFALLTLWAFRRLATEARSEVR